MKVNALLYFLTFLFSGACAIESTKFVPASIILSDHAKERMVEPKISRESIRDIIHNGDSSKLYDGRLKYTYNKMVVIADPCLTTIITVRSDDNKMTKKEKQNQIQNKRKKLRIKEKLLRQNVTRNIFDEQYQKSLIKEQERSMRQSRANKYDYDG
jgi:hypothetical protein